jgi:hypothetical protein
MPIEQPGRPNTAIAASVEEVLQTVEPCGRRHAARLMSARGVPFSVIVRVLAEPNKRRLSSTSAENTDLLRVRSTDR